MMDAINSLSPPYTREEAIVVRNVLKREVWGCWWCLFEGKEKAYWNSSQCNIIGHRNACPEHNKRWQEGNLRI